MISNENYLNKIQLSQKMTQTTLEKLTDEHTRVANQHGFRLKVAAAANPANPNEYALLRDNLPRIGEFVFPGEKMGYFFDDKRDPYRNEFVVSHDLDFEKAMLAASNNVLSTTHEYLGKLLDLSNAVTLSGLGYSVQNFDGSTASIIYRVPATDEFDTSKLGLFLERLDDYLKKM